MRRAGIGFGIVAWLAGVGAAQDSVPVHGATVETHVDRREFFVQEPIDLRVHFAFDEEYFEEHAVQRFQRPLDVPIQIVAAWLEELNGTVAIERKQSGESTPAGSRRTIAVNAGVESARLEAGPGDFLAIERRIVATEPGTIVLSAPVARFTLATRFEQDLFRDRVPIDPREVTIEGAPVSLTIAPLPEEGRPVAFSGAVGRFTLDSKADRIEVRVGESLRLEVTIEGDGNLPLFPTPRLENLASAADLARFHVYGATERKETGRRIVTFEIAPLEANLKEVPALALSYFEPSNPHGYRIASARSLPLKVTPDPDSASTPGPSRDGERRSSAPVVIAIAAVIVAIAAAAGAKRRRLAARSNPDPSGEAIRDAAARLRARASEPGADVARELQELLETGLPPPATNDPFHDLEGRLVTAGVPVELARRAITLLDEHVAVRFRAPGTADPDAAERHARTLALADELERVRATASRRDAR